MTLHDLKRHQLIYFATPYSKYAYGLETAFRHAAHLVGEIWRTSKIAVYSPIVFTHALARHAGFDPLDHSMWLPFDSAQMDKADALLIARMEGWDKSFGIDYEIKAFGEAGKPIYHLDPRTLELVA